jgi:Asp-tRNA(Asn)/Glu-tRNA(Gln) amidotransferase C subunit
MTASERRYSPETVAALADLVSLGLSPERVAQLATEISEMYADLDQLATVSLGEVPPATAFDARWE